MGSKTEVEQIVDKLQDFCDNFVQNHGMEKIHEKTAMVKQQVDSTIAMLKTLEEKCQKTTYMLQYARALNVLPDYSRECEDYLSKVVKRDPSIIQGWNLLGETFWKKGDIGAAKDCFEGGLKRKKDKVSLRSLSMVLRQLKADKFGDEQKNVISSVEMAKDAVGMDVEDGMSWYILGNAYLSLFFVTEQNPKVLAMALEAYSKAEKVEKRSTHNPDLHFNRAMAYRYEESYQLSLEGLTTADQLDPTWGSPRTKINEIFNYLDKVNDLVEKKGKMKSKRLQNMIKSIKETNLGPYSGGSFTINGKQQKLEYIPLSSLNEGANPEKVIMGKVVCNMADITLVPFTFAIIDHNGDCYAVTVYNLARGKGMIIGDSVAIPEPFMTHHKIEWSLNADSAKKWDFRNIRVDNPIVLIVNGRKLTQEHCGSTIAAMIPSQAS